MTTSSPTAPTPRRVSPDALRRWMSVRGYSPDTLARRAGVARSTIMAMLDGRYGIGHHATVCIAIALGCEPRDLT